jgi:hypothetical protein
MTNSTKTILSLLFFFPFGVYFYIKYKALNIYLFIALLIVGIIVFLPLWTIILGIISKGIFSFKDNVLLPLF